MTIPFDPAVRTGGSAMMFYQWLPLSEDQFITAHEGGMGIKFWFDWKCHALDPLPYGERDIDRMVTVPAYRVIIADLAITGVPRQLAQYVLDLARRNPPDESGPLADECRSLACRILEFAVLQFNRLVGCVYSTKGQYWLEEYPFDPDNVASYFIRFDARVKAGESQWLRFYVPGPGGVWRGNPTQTSARSIRKEDWTKVRELMGSHRKPPLVGQLLARADWLANSGHRRGAVSEAVSALEVAIHAFGRQPSAQKAFGPVKAAGQDGHVPAGPGPPTGHGGSLRPGPLPVH
jgi:hypothetical protein